MTEVNLNLNNDYVKLAGATTAGAAAGIGTKKAADFLKNNQTVDKFVLTGTEKLQDFKSTIVNSSFVEKTKKLGSKIAGFFTEQFSKVKNLKFVQTATSKISELATKIKDAKIFNNNFIETVSTKISSAANAVKNGLKTVVAKVGKFFAKPYIAGALVGAIGFVLGSYANDKLSNK